MKDWRGTEVKVGDLVVYPGRQGSSLWMIEGEVVELVEGNPDAESYWDRTPHSLKIKRLRESRAWKDIVQRVFPVKLDSVTVVGAVSKFETYESPLDLPKIEIDGRAS